MQLRIFTEPQQGASYDDQLRVAQATERLGFDAFFRSDHYLSGGSADGLPGPTDSWTTLAGLARETSRIRLGTLVSSATFRYPGILAIQVAQVDQMSGGRVELGLGAGWFGREHEAYGIPFPERRFDRLEEQLEVITGLWSTPAGQVFDYSGEHYTLKESPALPKPVQEHIPVIIGGRGPKRTPALTAKYAAEFNIPGLRKGETTELFGRVHKACEEIGRDPDELRYSAWVTVACGRDEAEFRRRAAAIRREPDKLRQDALGGTVQDVIDRLGEYQAMGMNRVYLQVLDLSDIDHLELIAAEVAPHVA